MLTRLALVLALCWVLPRPSKGVQNEPVDAAAEPAPSDEIAPEEVDLRLRFAAATMNHRLLVYQRCVDGSCSSATYLQWFKTEWSADLDIEVVAPTRTILANCALAELSGDLLVHRAWWVTEIGADPVLRVATSPPAEAEPSREVQLTPGRPCDYRLESVETGGETPGDPDP